MKLAWKQIIIAFLLGAVVTALGTYACPFYRRPWGWGKGGHFQEKMLKRFDARLHLTPDQEKEVAAILAQKRGKIDALRSEIRPKFEAIRKTTRAEIRQILTPEQQTKFDKMSAEWEERAGKFRNRWEGGK